MAAIIEVIIGMIFVYILLSILVTEINGLVVKATHLRTKNLRQALDDIIEDPVMRAKVYTHPLIRLVNAETVPPAQRISRAEAAKIASGPVGKVDWIEPAAFADVVISTIKVDADQRLFGPLLNVIDGMPSSAERRGLRLLVNRVMASTAGMAELRHAVKFVQQRHYRSALIDILNQIDEEIGRAGLQLGSSAALMTSLRQPQNSTFHSALSTVMAATPSIDEAHANLETWFNRAMTQASSDYQAKMKNLSIAVALILALAVNIDTLHIARTLWEDPLVRQQLSGEVAATVQSTQFETAIDDAPPADPPADDDALDAVIQTSTAVASQLQEINDLRLPIGWLHEDLSATAADHPARSSPNNLWNYHPDNNPDGWLGLLLTKALGIAATVISTAQGAPFWFNIINKFLSR